MEELRDCRVPLLLTAIPQVTARQRAALDIGSPWMNTKPYG